MQIILFEIGVGGRINGQNEASNAKEAHFVGNYVYVNVGKENEKNTINVDSLKGTAVKEGFLQRDMTSFAGDGYVFGNFGTIEKTSYNETNSVDFTKAITIDGHYDGSQLDNETNANEWKFFADGWNRQNITGDIFKDGLTTIRLISDIDFNGYQAIDPVGAVIAFSGKFDGGGYTLKNLTIKAQTGNWNTGVFGKVEGTSGKKAQIYNLTVDNLKFSGKTNSGGGFVAQSKDAEFYNIHLKNYNDLNFYDFGNGQNTFGGGFVGYADSGSKFENITLENFGTITLTPNGVLNSKEIKSYLGGFAGYDNSGVYNNILLSGFKGIKIEAYGNGTSLYTGGFIGYSKNSSFRNITLNNFGNIYSGYVLDESNKMGQIYDSIAGGFAGVIDGNKLDIENISLNNFGDIEARRGIIYYQNASYLAAAGGFAGMIKLENQVNGNISNIFLNFDNNKIYAQKTISNTTLRSDYDYAGGFAGLFQGNNFSSNFVIGNIDLKFGKVNIDTYSKNGQSFNRGVFTGYIDSFRNINNIRIFYSNEDGGLKANPQSDYWDTNNRLGNLFTDITYDLNKKGDRVLYIYDDKSNENNEKVNNLIKEKFANLDNNGYVNFYNPSATNNPDIPNFKDPILSQNDFDPKLLQRILDDLMNGKYTYDFDTKTWTYTDSKGVVGENEASEITQSLNFLNAFKDTGVEQEFVNLWKNSQDQNYKNYANLYEKWTQKKTAMDKIKTGEGYFASFKEELQKYQEALAQLDKENKNYEKIKESGLVSDETLKVMYEKLLEQKEALEKQFADLSGNEGFHYKLENEILNSQGFSIEGKDVDDKAYTGNFNFKGKLASLPEKPNISIYEPDKQGGEDPDKPSVLPPEIPEKVVEAPIKIQTEVDTKKEEDDDQVEIGEADARSSGLRCIVSDNFKTMNICVNAK